MKQQLTKFFSLIKNDKQTRFLTIITILLLFIFTLGYSLSMFNGSNVKEAANINVNGLSFNITTNSGETDDRVLHLQAGKTEQFNVVLTNLNKVNTKYELIYELCNDSKCTSTSKAIPNTITVVKEEESTEISGIINSNNNKEIVIVTNNTSSTDYYIKLNLNAGYEWNDLALTKQINKSSGGNATQIIAYVDGKEVTSFPDTCNYIAEIKGYNGSTEVKLENAKVTCDFKTKKWATYYIGHASKIVINFTPGLNPGTFTEDSWDKIAEVVRNGQGIAYEVGSEKEVLIDNSYYTVRVANNTTPDECNQEGFSQTACGFVVEFVDIVEKRIINSKDTNVGGWPATDIRTYANGEFFNKLSSDLQKNIIDTYVVSNHGRTSGEINFISTDKIYLLSGHEIWEDESKNKISERDTAYYNTRQLDYYKNNGVTTNNYKYAIKKYNGSNSIWWLRSALSTGVGDFLRVNYDGAWTNESPTAKSGYAPAFRIG